MNAIFDSDSDSVDSDYDMPGTFGGRGLYVSLGNRRSKIGYETYKNDSIGTGINKQGADEPTVVSIPTDDGAKEYLEYMFSEGVQKNVIAEHIVAHYVEGYTYLPKSFDGLYKGKLVDVKFMHHKQLTEYRQWLERPTIDLSNKQAYFMQKWPNVAGILCVTEVMEADMPAYAHGRWKQHYTVQIDYLDEFELLNYGDNRELYQQYEANYALGPVYVPDRVDDPVMRPERQPEIDPDV